MMKGNLFLIFLKSFIFLIDSSWNLSYQIEPKETPDNTDSLQQQKSQENSSPTNRSRPLKAYVVNAELIIKFVFFFIDFHPKYHLNHLQQLIIQ
jgi:hypothetical protein